MLKQLDEFRQKLDRIMNKCLHSRIVIYGYDTYTGRFLNWYAYYYHSISVDFFVSEDMSVGKGYDREIFRPSVFDFRYKDIKNAVIWLAQPLDNKLKDRLERWGYKRNTSYYDIYEEIYREDFSLPDVEASDVYHVTKTGRRDIQFLEFLEWKYGCNLSLPFLKTLFRLWMIMGLDIVVQHRKNYFQYLTDAIFILQKAMLFLILDLGRGVR